MERHDLEKIIFDVLIIGGGPAGATTGLLLAQAGWTVGIVEKKSFPRRKVCGEFMSAINLSLLHDLGIADFFLRSSGPEIKRVGLYAADVVLTMDMPTVDNLENKWGRALGREHLDAALLNRAAELGAKVWQQSTVEYTRQPAGLFKCTVLNTTSREEITSRLLIMANGSWENNRSHSVRGRKHKSSDLLAFKAHFRNTTLPVDLMPLIAFPGGYGGLVQSDSGRTSLSFCIRRDRLDKVRTAYPGLQAGEAALNYIKTQCVGVQKVLALAQREGSWLACGPIQPGIRQQYAHGIFFVGNSAGEAHPIIAEGISMAMQSAWLLSHILMKHKKEIIENNMLHAAKEYKKQWRQHVATRIYMAALFSYIAMRPCLQKLMVYFIQHFPNLLTLGAQLSGKIKPIRSLNYKDN